MEFLRHAYRRLTELVRELAKFGTVGAVAFVVDYGGTNLLRFGLDQGPLTSKVIATIVAATLAYVGNRYWTFRHREQSGLAREYFLFFMLNGIGLLISLLIIGFATYTLGLKDALSYNIALIVSTALGTLFRFWSYKKWVFLPSAPPPEEIVPGASPNRPAAPNSQVNGHMYLLNKTSEESSPPTGPR
ncbi:GtrA family protein [Streptosporangium oxazolinicum]|uniref:GtrA family protein n=1 Tax=Streptosporangium oxazolinicum TaxID=909287 RepID=A0ABP8BFN8_9ACTN